MKNKQIILPILLSLGLTLATTFSVLYKSPYIAPFIERLELLIYDMRLSLMLEPYDPALPVVILDISEESLANIGQWPWSRDVVAKIVDRSFELGAAVVSFDVVFAEEERNSATTVIDRLRSSSQDDELTREVLSRRLPLFDNNLILAKAFTDSEVVLGYTFNNDVRTKNGTLPDPIVTDIAVEKLDWVMSPSGFTSNILMLHEASTGGGFFSLELTPDTDGVIRRAPLLSRYNNGLYPSLSLESVRRFMLDEYKIYTTDLGGNLALDGVEIGGIRIPTDQGGRMTIPYHGPSGTFPYISAHNLLKEGFTTTELEDAIVLIGASAQGLLDLRNSPLGVNMPGVEIHANIISGILNENLYSEPPWANAANLLVLLAVGIFLSFTLPFLTAGTQITTALVVLFGLIVTNFWLWSEQHFVLELAPQLLLALLLSIFNGFNSYLSSISRERYIKGIFSQYIPPELVQKMGEQSDKDYSLEGQTRELSVLFADIRGFTTISEKLQANDLRIFLNQFFTPMTRIIFENKGTIDKYVGDMIMAFWGAPVDDSEHAKNSVIAAIGMIKTARKMADRNEKSGLPRFDIGVGINTGNMSVGDMGSEYRRAYTVLGDSVNLASRLEGLTKYYGVDIIVGERTRELTSDTFVYRSLDIVKAKGKEEAVEIFSPECLVHETSEQLGHELDTYHLALKKYRGKEWEVAQTDFLALAEQYPESKIYGLYVDRCNELLLTTPADDWTPEFVHTSK